MRSTTLSRWPMASVSPTFVQKILGLRAQFACRIAAARIWLPTPKSPGSDGEHGDTREVDFMFSAAPFTASRWSSHIADARRIGREKSRHFLEKSDH